MNKSVLRFTLSNTTLGIKVITEPIGAMENPLTLQRDWTLHCIQETFTANLTMFYEAIDYLAAAIAIGIDIDVNLLVEVSNDYAVTWEQYYSGLIDMESLQPIADTRDYKVQNVIKRNDLWSTFINRKDTVVDVNSALDLDGNAVAAPIILSPNLPTQPVDRQSRVSIHDYADPGKVLQLYYVDGTIDGWVQDLPLVVYDDLKTKHNLPSGLSINVTELWLMTVEEPGLYDFNIDLLFARNDVAPGTPKYKLDAPGFAVTTPGLWLKNRMGSPTLAIPLVRTDLGTDGVDGCTRFKLVTAGVALVKGDTIAIVFRPVFASYPQNIYTVFGGVVIDPATGVTFINSFISIIGHTTGTDSVAQGYLLKDVAGAIIKRITGKGLFSNLLNAGGCMYNYWLCKGIQMRIPSSFGQYPFSMSFSEFLNGLDPITPVGIDTYVDAGTEKISIENASEFYDTAVSINLSYVKGIVTSFAKGKATKSVKIGYEKWQLTAGGSLIDDPQTQHTYAPPLKRVGQNIVKLSKWIAASLLFELTKRAGKLKPRETWDLDNDFFILRLKDDLTGPDVSGAATNLLNPTLRYNKFLTPARNFLRWLKFFNVGLNPQYTGSPFRFTGGVGNVLCGVTLNPGCPGSQVAALVENADVAITNSVEYGIKQVDFMHPLNWEQYKIIKANRRKAIGVSQTGDSWVPYFIDKIDFYFFKKIAKFTLRATV